MEAVLHFSIPFLIATMWGMKWKRAFLFSVVSVLPDLDALVNMHRVLFHSAVTCSAIFLLMWVVGRESRWRREIMLAYLFVLGHLFVDVFYGYSALAWPVTQYGYGVFLTLKAAVGGSIRLVSLEADVRSVPIQYLLVSREAYALTGQGLSIAILIASSIAIKRRKISGSSTRER